MGDMETIVCSECGALNCIMIVARVDDLYRCCKCGAGLKVCENEQEDSGVESDS